MDQFQKTILLQLNATITWLPLKEFTSPADKNMFIKPVYFDKVLTNSYFELEAFHMAQILHIVATKKQSRLSNQRKIGANPEVIDFKICDLSSNILK
jgi:hypothetical protein